LLACKHILFQNSLSLCGASTGPEKTEIQRRNNRAFATGTPCAAQWYCFFTHDLMKEWAEFITKHLSNVVEILAGFVIAVTLIQFLIRYLLNFARPGLEQNNQAIRIQVGSSTAIALELLLAADILATAIAPTWDDIGKLAAIATLRTALNYFLERELKTTQKPNEPLLHKTNQQDAELH